MGIPKYAGGRRTTPKSDEPSYLFLVTKFYLSHSSQGMPRGDCLKVIQNIYHAKSNLILIQDAPYLLIGKKRLPTSSVQEHSMLSVKLGDWSYMCTYVLHLVALREFPIGASLNKKFAYALVNPLFITRRAETDWRHVNWKFWSAKLFIRVQPL